MLQIGLLKRDISTFGFLLILPNLRPGGW